MSLPKTYGLFRLTRDAELKYSQSGSAILKMGLASSEKFGDKETQCFMDATAFGKMAEVISQYAGEKGTQIFLTGKIQTESWETDGQRRYKNSMIVEGFDFVSNKGGERKPPEIVHERKPMPDNSFPEIDINEDEIPF